MQVFNVQGMTCGHCVKAVTRAVQEQDAAAKSRSTWRPDRCGCRVSWRRNRFLLRSGMKGIRLNSPDYQPVEAGVPAKPVGLLQMFSHS